MSTKITAIALAVAMTGATALATSPASAQRWHHHRSGGWWGPAAGFAAGALIGSALTAPRYYYGPGYGYYDDYAYEAPGGNAVAYCMQRFRSYDPASGTYLGYDGERHPCP
jgi:hypothetical protein